MANNDANETTRVRCYNRCKNGYIERVEVIRSEDGEDEFWAHDPWDLTPYCLMPTPFERDFARTLEGKEDGPVPLVDIDESSIDYTVAEWMVEPEFLTSGLRYLDAVLKMLSLASPNGEQSVAEIIRMTREGRALAIAWNNNKKRIMAWMARMKCAKLAAQQTAKRQTPR